MPRTNDDSDDEELDAGLGLVHDRTSSTVSMEIHERLEALQRTNEELARKRVDAEVTLQNKLAEHELELEETHQRLEELRSELTASNREEKELRAKDVCLLFLLRSRLTDCHSRGTWPKSPLLRPKSQKYRKL